MPASAVADWPGTQALHLPGNACRELALKNGKALDHVRVQVLANDRCSRPCSQMDDGRTVTAIFGPTQDDSVLAGYLVLIDIPAT
jgi:hypothetical protein